jgi:hypothetical protein
MKVLFLDFDGVLNCFDHIREARRRQLFTKDRRKHDLAMLDPLQVLMINRVCERTGAKIVFSTSWRINATTEYLFSLLQELGFQGEHAGETPKPQDIRSKCRGDEVLAYLAARQGQIEAFAIVDDMGPKAFPGLRPYLVWTSTALGLQEEGAERLVAILGAG